MTADTTPNIDRQTVDGFGEEWNTFDQTTLTQEEWQRIFNLYFAVFPWNDLPADAEGFDLGCGSGRWSRGVAPKVGRLHCVDPSDKALAVAERSLARFDNVTFHLASVDAIPLPNESQDFGFSLGVLHHVPNTAEAIRSCVAKLKPGAPFLVYLYYAFDNRPAWFKGLWRASDRVRRRISALPFRRRVAITNVVATTIYWPLARASAMAERFGRNVDNWPLSAYRAHSFYTMRTDALDRFGTRLEQRFTREQIRRMMQAAGLVDVRFHEDVPYWVACGTKAEHPA